MKVKISIEIEIESPKGPNKAVTLGILQTIWEERIQKHLAIDGGYSESQVLAMEIK